MRALIAGAGVIGTVYGAHLRDRDGSRRYLAGLEPSRPLRYAARRL